MVGNVANPRLLTVNEKLVYQFCGFLPEEGNFDIKTNSVCVFLVLVCLHLGAFNVYSLLASSIALIR